MAIEPVEEVPANVKNDYISGGGGWQAIRDGEFVHEQSI